MSYVERMRPEDLELWNRLRPLIGSKGSYQQDPRGNIVSLIHQGEDPSDRRILIGNDPVHPFVADMGAPVNPAQDVGRILAAERGSIPGVPFGEMSFLDYPQESIGDIINTGQTKEDISGNYRLYTSRRNPAHQEWLPYSLKDIDDSGWGSGIGGVMSRVSPIIMAAGPALAMGNLPGAGIALAGASARSAGSDLPISGALGTALNLGTGNWKGALLSGYGLYNQVEQAQKRSALRDALMQRAQAKQQQRQQAIAQQQQRRSMLANILAQRQKMQQQNLYRPTGM